MWSFMSLPGGAYLFCLFVFLGLAPPGSAAQAAEQGTQERALGDAIGSDTKAVVFDLEKVSAFDLIERCPEFGIGQRVQCRDTLDPNVTAYPAFRSAKPIYGLVRIAGEVDRRDSGLCLRFWVDESAGTGQGYDRLALDLNLDLNLTNDRVLTRQKDRPKGLGKYPSIKEEACFETVGIPLAFGSGGVRPLEVLPRLIINEDGYKSFALITTTARRGRITLAGQEFDVLLGHNYAIAGWFDRPGTALHLIPSGARSGFSWWGGDQLNATHKIGSLFYRFSATPAGDTLTVRPYAGLLGTFEIGAGGRKVDPIDVKGSLRSEETAAAVGGEMEHGRPESARSCRVPVGDYLPTYLTVTYGRLRIGISDNYHSDGIPRDTLNRPRTYGIKIREDKPYTFDFSHTPSVLFASPAKGRRVKAGEELMVKAVLIDPVLDFMIRDLADTTRRQKRELSLGNNRSQTVEEDLSLDPTVVITRANGEKVAQGVMPFG
jgi:hypothetical protein